MIVQKKKKKAEARQVRDGFQGKVERELRWRKQRPKRWFYGSDDWIKSRSRSAFGSDMRSTYAGPPENPALKCCPPDFSTTKGSHGENY